MESDNSTWLLPISTSLILIGLFLIVTKFRSTVSNKHQPPGPPGWPVIGNILDLGGDINQSLYKLRFKYGDLLWLRLGRTNTLVVQTAKAAEELFKHHDSSFCNRTSNEASTAHNFHMGALGLRPYGSTWRALRRLVTLGLTSGKKIQDTASVRRKCVDDMVRFVQEDSEARRNRGESGEIELAKHVFNMSFNLIGNLILSRDLVNPQSEHGNEFFYAMDKVMELSGKMNLADLFPFLKRFDPQRVKKNTEIHLGKLLSIVEEFVMERIEDRKLNKQKGGKDFLDSMLDYNESGDGEREGQEAISTHNVFISIVEMFFGGTDTTSATIEWVMTELLGHQESMAKVKEELNQVIGPNRKVEESDVDHLPYLQAVIKESMRLHPVIPLLLPRNTIEDTTLMGYFIPKDTRVFVNAWAIGRDPDVWEDPLTFKPERFLGSNIQYRGQNFELIPFGSGRRMCVGYPLAHQVLHLTVATLLHCFDWEISSKSDADVMDVNERSGLTVRKLIPLKVIPKKKIMEE